MSAETTIPELYKAEDIRREATELERVSRLRQMTDRIEWLRTGYFVVAGPISVVLFLSIYFVLSVLHYLPQTNQISFLLGFFGLAMTYALTALALEWLSFRDRMYDKVCEMRNLFAFNEDYRDTLENLKQRDPALAKRICRMKFVTGGFAD